MKKQNYLWTLFCFVVTTTMSLGFVSCGGGDDPEVLLKVNPTEISLLAEKGSNSTFSIITDGEWQANCASDWLHLSSTSGNGDATITVSAVSANDSDVKRDAIINVQSGDKVVSINVSQDAKYISAYADVNIDNMVILTKSIAFEVTGRGNVSFFRLVTLPKSSSAGLTDDKIVSQNTKNWELADDEVYWIPDLTQNTDYYLYTVAFDEKGNQGPVQRFEFKTARSVTNRPRITYGSVIAKDGYWKWTTTMNAYTKKYYMLATDDVNFINFLRLTSEAYIAYCLKEDVNRGELTPLIQNGDWNMSKNSNYFLSASWAIGENDAFAGEIDLIGGGLSNSRSTTKMTLSPKFASAKKIKLSGRIVEVE